VRTSIVIDDNLVAEAMAASGITSKSAVIELGLKSLIRQHAFAELKSLRGKIAWTGDLESIRRD
jgi:Arc/MetJ family transcription regulator